MTSGQEQKLRIEATIILNSLAVTSRMLTMNDPALGLVIQQIAMDATSVYWDRYKALYLALKDTKMNATGE